MKSATAAAEPLDEPPGVCALWCGLRVCDGWLFGELGGDRLAEDHAARLLEERHARCICLRPVARGRWASCIRWANRPCRDVLDAEGHAVQARAARHAVERARLREGRDAVDERPRAHCFIALGDALEAGGDERFRGCFARGQAASRFGAGYFT